MRKVTANYIFPVSSPPLKNGIIELDDKGRIENIIDTRGNLEETSKLEFYNGILVPGFINPYCRIEPYIFNRNINDFTSLERFTNQELPAIIPGPELDQQFNSLDHYLRKTGITGLGCVTGKYHFFRNKSESQITYHSFIEIPAGEKPDPFESFRNALENMTTAWNEYQLPCSVIPYEIFRDEEVLACLTEFATNHNNPLILQCSDRNIPSEIIIGKFSETLARITGETNPDALSKFRNTILIPSGNISEIQHELNPDIFYILLSDNPGSPEYIFSPGKIHKVCSAHILFSSYGYSFHTYSPIISELIDFQLKVPGLNLEELISWCTINPARALRLINQLGSLETGKIPGINLVTNIDFNNMKLTEKSELMTII